MKTFYSLFVLSFSLSIFADKSTAQDFTCGTYPTKEQIIYERTHPKVYATEIIKKADVKLSITAHIVKKRSGSAAINESTILAAVDLMNADFAPINMSFEVCEFRYIDNWEYSYMHQDTDQAEMLVKYLQPNTINIFFCDVLEKNGPVQFPCGYAPLGIAPSEPYIFMRKICTTSSVTLSHEMGHFMGLYHTFETGFGAELANGSNCATAGDLLCDTQADPNGSVYAGSCEYVEKSQDANGDWYYPPIGNIMSYYLPACKCPVSEHGGAFTPQQYNRMVDMFWTNRKDLW